MKLVPKEVKDVRIPLTPMVYDDVNMRVCDSDDELCKELARALMDEENEEVFQNITAKLINEGWHDIAYPIAEFDEYCKKHGVSFSELSIATERGLSMKDEFFLRIGLKSFSRKDLRKLLSEDAYETIAYEIYDKIMQNKALPEEEFPPALVELMQKMIKEASKPTRVIKVVDIDYETDFEEVWEYFNNDILDIDEEKAAKLLGTSPEELEGMDEDEVHDTLYDRYNSGDVTIHDVFDLPKEMEIPKSELRRIRSSSDYSELIEDYITESAGFFPIDYKIMK